MSQAEHSVLLHLGKELGIREASQTLPLPDPCSPLLLLLEEKCAAFSKREIQSRTAKAVMQADLLHKLNQRIALDMELLKEQKARIEELKREGQETAEAEEILDALEEALEVDIVERETALRAIEVQYLTPDNVPSPSDTDGPFGGIPAGARRFLDVIASPQPGGDAASR